MVGCRLSGFEERVLEDMVEETRDSKELKPMDWSMHLVPLSLGPTAYCCSMSRWCIVVCIIYRGCELKLRVEQSILSKLLEMNNPHRQEGRHIKHIHMKTWCTPCGNYTGGMNFIASGLGALKVCLNCIQLVGAYYIIPNLLDRITLIMLTIWNLLISQTSHNNSY